MKIKKGHLKYKWYISKNSNLGITMEGVNIYLRYIVAHM
jgi:hypothetical protein